MSRRVETSVLKTTLLPNFSPGNWVGAPIPGRPVAPAPYNFYSTKEGRLKCVLCGLGLAAWYVDLEMLEKMLTVSLRLSRALARLAMISFIKPLRPIGVCLRVRAFFTVEYIDSSSNRACSGLFRSVVRYRLFIRYSVLQEVAYENVSFAAASGLETKLNLLLAKRSWPSRKFNLDV